MDNLKNILFIAHSYSSFQKDSINEVSKHFKKTNVLVRSNPIAEIANYIPIHSLDRFKLSAKIDKKNIPSNVNVYSTPIVYAPLDLEYKKLGERHLKEVEKSIKKNNIKFDIVQSHFTWSAGYVGAKLKEKYDIPVIVTAHGYDIYRLPFKDENWKKRIGYVLNSADHIITVSNNNLECIKKLDIKTPVSVIPNGYNDEMFYPRNNLDCKNSLGLPTDKKIIVSVGNLAEIKGHKYLISALSEVTKTKKDVYCYIVGGGALKNKLQKQIDTLNLNNNVKLVGAKPHEEIPIWMNAADLFVLPSLNEGNPTVLVEALSTGLPFIGTNVGGISEIINSDEYGLLCDPKNPEKLAENILIGLEKDWDTEKILEYSEEFTWENISKKILNVYTKVLK
ncbi:glycosyltransferase [Methanococcus maripaludis]|uniref:Glycosyltransferase involved in cell wall biosynthesis n=1 Tax=Methanococcus maripaludis TaxID=39152 RepID=A0A7J9PCA8_METMI|nr:glycosyltransferase [Methanococcus maripaludis]MBA2860464.1 glycosyltransferase involved in cell wall biosynthesis [Methanococcus maripaludis]